MTSFLETRLCIIVSSQMSLIVWIFFSFVLLQPPGGVREGQVFSAPFGSAQTEGTPFLLGGRAATTNHTHSMGHWKDGLWDCFRPGIFHPSLWHSICCPQILMAQVMTRLKLNWLGERAPDTEWKRTFPIICVMVSVYYLLSTTLSPPGTITVRDAQTGTLVRVEAPPPPMFQVVLSNLLFWAFSIYSWIVLTKLRHAVRVRYEIPPQYTVFPTPWLEDACLSFLCGCCSVAQMARQTCDYSEQDAACCTATGLRPPAFSETSAVLTV